MWKPKSMAESLSRFWWVKLPLVSRRLSRGLLVTLLDGIYLIAWPRVAALATPLVVVAGFLLGLHPGPDSTSQSPEAFSQFLAVLILAVVVGALSGQLGTGFLVGYIVGDFFFATTGWDAILEVRVPLLITYALLSLPTIFFPLFTKALVVRLTILPRVGHRLGAWVSVAGGGVVAASLSWVLVYLWTDTASVLLRPVFTWQEASIPAEAILGLQSHSILLATLAAAASAVRIGLQALTTYSPTYSRSLDNAQEQLTSASPLTPLVERVPVPLRVTTKAAILTLLLAGLYSFWLEGVALGVLILLVTGARQGLISVPLGRWPDLVERVPLALRFGVGLLAVFLLALPVSALLVASETFRPLVALTAVSVVVFYLLDPLAPEARTKPEDSEPA